MQVLVGLGNPGSKYRYTRHNVGFRFLDFMVAEVLLRAASGVEYHTNQNWKLSKAGQLEYFWLSSAQLVSTQLVPPPRLASPQLTSSSQPFLSAQPNQKIELVKPQTFMNRSGLSVAYIKKKQPQLTGENLWVIHDDLDLEIGSYKIQFGKGPKQHHGLASIYQQFQTDQFWHVRIGVDGRHGDRSIPADKYVLSSFKPEEQALLKTTFEQIFQDLTGLRK